MIGFGAPGFLIAGAAAALAALALHLIVHTPPRRAALPTARFLSGARASMIRVRRTPSDVLLLAVRMLFALAFGAAFARPVWTGGGTDSTHVVLLDRGAGMGDGWSAAVDSVRPRAAERADIVLVTFDTAAVIYPAGRLVPARIDSLAAAGPALIESDYRVAFRALREALASARAARYSVTLVTAPRWSAYREGTGAVRRTAWPGPVQVVSVTAPAPPPPGSGLPRVAARRGSALADAVESLGWTAMDSTAAGVVSIAEAAEGVGPAGWRRVRSAAAGTGAGGPLSTAGASAAGPSSTGRAGAAGPSSAAGISGVAPAGIVFRDGWTLAVPRAGVFVPAPGAGFEAVAVWRDGAVAAVVGRDGAACRIETAFPIDSGAVTTEPWYPELVRRLGASCAADGAAGAEPLDSGAVAVLRGDDTFDGTPPVRRSGRAVGAPLLALALLLAVAEWPLRNRRRAAES